MTIEFISAPWDGAQFHAPLTQAEYRERSTTATRRALRELRHQIPHHRLKHENRLFRPRDLLLGLVVGFLLVVIPLLLSWFVTQRQEVRVVFTGTHAAIKPYFFLDALLALKYCTG
jgi:hypothetical protein